MHFSCALAKNKNRAQTHPLFYWITCAMIDPNVTSLPIETRIDYFDKSKNIYFNGNPPILIDSRYFYPNNECDLVSLTQ